MSDPNVNEAPESPISFITIKVDYEDGFGSPEIDLGDFDLWAAYSILQSVVDRVGEMLPYPHMVGEEVDVEWDEE